MAYNSIKDAVEDFKHLSDEYWDEVESIDKQIEDIEAEGLSVPFSRRVALSNAVTVSGIYGEAGKIMEKALTDNSATAASVINELQELEPPESAKEDFTNAFIVIAKELG